MALTASADQAVISRSVHGDEACAPDFTSQELLDLARRLAHIPAGR